MATTHTLGTSRMGDPSAWGRLLIGIAIGAMVAGLFSVWLNRQDVAADTASVPTAVSGYTLSKVLQAEDSGVVGVARPGAAPAQQVDYSLRKVTQVRASGIAGPSTYTMTKVLQAQDSGAGEAAIAGPAPEVGPDSYSLYKLDQVKGSASRAILPTEPNLSNLVE